MSSERLVLDFHGIGEVPSGVPTDEGPYWCPTEVFTAILDNLPQVQQATGVRVELTFDDGNATDIDIAAPALVERHLEASFFLCAGRIGTPGFLDEPAVGELRAAGMRIGSHGWDHVPWRHLDASGLAREVMAAKDAISHIADADVDAVAIPFGQYDRRVLSWVRRAGFRTVYTSDGGRARGAERLTPRESYTTAWDGHTLAVLAGDRVDLRQVVRNRTVRFFKRWR